MTALWRLESGTVEEVRQALPPDHRGGYNTVQTVLNRLAKRQLMARKRRGRTYVYRRGLTGAHSRVEVDRVDVGTGIGGRPARGARSGHQRPATR